MNPTVPLPPGMTPRQWQIEAMRAIYENIEVSSKILVSAATGTGKGSLIAALAVRMAMAEKRLLFLVHRDELIDDVIRRVKACLPGADVGKVKGKTDQSDRQLVFASVQSLRGDRLSRLDGFDVVVTDEAHHATAPTYLAIYRHIGAVNPGWKHIGFTATPFRYGGSGKTEGLGKAFERLVYEYPLVKAIEDGALCPIRGIAVETELDLSGVDPDEVEKVSKIVDTESRNQIVAAKYLELAAGMPAICFAVTVQHAANMASALTAAGVPAEAVWGTDPNRAEKIARYKAGTTKVLCNCELLTEGFDAPQTEAVILVRPTGSIGLYSQMVGRVTRLHPGKLEGLVIDFVGNAAKYPLVRLSDLTTSQAKLETDLPQATPVKPAPLSPVVAVGARHFDVELFGNLAAETIKSNADLISAISIVDRETGGIVRLEGVVPVLLGGSGVERYSKEWSDKYLEVEHQFARLMKASGSFSRIKAGAWTRSKWTTDYVIRCVRWAQESIPDVGGIQGAGCMEYSTKNRKELQDHLDRMVESKILRRDAHRYSVEKWPEQDESEFAVRCLESWLSVGNAISNTLGSTKISKLPPFVTKLRHNGPLTLNIEKIKAYLEMLGFDAWQTMEHWYRAGVIRKDEFGEFLPPVATGRNGEIRLPRYQRADHAEKLVAAWATPDKICRAHGPLGSHIGVWLESGELGLVWSKVQELVESEGFVFETVKEEWGRSDVIRYFSGNPFVVERFGKLQVKLMVFRRLGRMTLEEAAAELGVTSEETIKNWLCGGAFPGATKEGYVWLFQSAEVARVKADMEDARKKNAQKDIAIPDVDAGKPPLF